MPKDITYNRYYQTPDLFGAPYNILVEFFKQHSYKGRVLDLGCGQGRDAIAIARLGYEVVGIDHSQVGIDQMNAIAKKEALTLSGSVEDMYTYDQYASFDIILMDSMFHFAKMDKEKEINFLQTLISKAKPNCTMVICIQDSGKKVETLKKALGIDRLTKLLVDERFLYTYVDQYSDHSSTSDYRLIVVEKDGQP